MKNFQARSFVRRKTNQLSLSLREKKTIIAVSGGIDSTVCALLVQHASKEPFIALYLDTGMMRSNEKETTTALFAKHKIELQVWDVQDRFFEALQNKLDPEEKRKTFRDTFYRVFSQAIRSYSADILVQGTILPDIMETQHGIKTYHNVLQQAGINPNHYGLQILEPLRELTKSQAKSVAKHIGLPKKIINQWPFPGPGLSLRVVGEVNPDRVEIARRATTIIEKNLRSPAIFQAFPVLLSNKATGIANNTRILGETVVVRAVESKDGLTAKPYRFTWKKMEQLSNQILKEIPGIVKVLFDTTPKPPSTIEYF
ncbi:MAG: ATP-binding protein [Candidatus Ratteibacteria bacterium]|jgi:GMP synthase (glutamine-hydrolysing)